MAWQPGVGGGPLGEPGQGPCCAPGDWMKAVGGRMEGKGASPLLLSPAPCSHPLARDWHKEQPDELKPGCDRRSTVCLALGQRRWWWWYLVESTEIQDLVTTGKTFTFKSGDSTT